MSRTHATHERRTTSGKTTVALGAILLGALGALGTISVAQGCSEERVNPLATTSTATTPPPDASTPPPDAPPIRTVIQRNPYGNVAATDNLLWDGDFEWSSPFSDEYGWYQGVGAQATAANVSDVEVGPACRSGVKCARLKKGQSLLGIAVASKDKNLDASVYVKFEDDGAGTPCSKVKAMLVGDGLFDDPTVKLVAPETPDQDGWCKLAVTAAKRLGKVYLQVIDGGSSTMLVDDAVLRPTDDAVTTDGGALLDADDAADVEAARAMIRSLRGPHDAPPNEARTRFDAWKNRKTGGVEP